LRRLIKLRHAAIVLAGFLALHPPTTGSHAPASAHTVHLSNTSRPATGESTVADPAGQQAPPATTIDLLLLALVLSSTAGRKESGPSGPE
jgi:hypothetical protein